MQRVSPRIAICVNTGKMEQQMNKMIKGLGVAALVSFGAAGAALADGHTAMDRAMQCNAEYNACLASMDTMLASTPEEGVMKLQSNADIAAQCNQAAWACHTGN